MCFKFFSLDGLNNKLNSTICEFAEKQLENINHKDLEYKSIFINIKLTNSLFYKIIPVIIKSSTNWHQSYLLTNTITQMLIYVDRCNKVCIYILINTFNVWTIEIVFVYLGK